MCSNQGMPLYYKSPRDEVSEQFYYQEEPTDPMNNLTNSNYAQYLQLTTKGLMPGGWNGGEQAIKGADGCITDGDDDDRNGWYDFAPTQAGFQNYIQASGACRAKESSRDPMRKKLGVRNLLRAPPPIPVSNDNCVFFNDSSYRQDISSSLRRGPVNSEWD